MKQNVDTPTKEPTKMKKRKVYCGECKSLVRHKTHYPDCVIATWENTFHGGIPQSEGDDIHLGMSCWISREPAALKNINNDCKDYVGKDDSH